MDESLARGLREGEGVLRTYRWSRPTLSFGRNQPSRGRYESLTVSELGVDIVRRPTGGREVLHDRELTYSVVLPIRSLGGMREGQRVLSLALVSALRSLGAPASIAAPAGRSPAPDAGACFAHAAPGEITVAGRKLVGSAQARFGRVLLQHGSLLLGPPSVDPMSVREPAGALPVGSRSVRVPGSGGPARTRSDPDGISLAEILPGPIHFGTVAAAVEAALAGALGGRWRRSEPTSGERDAAAGFLPHYESPSWTWRR